jgi:hypothetical protein
MSTNGMFAILIRFTRRDSGYLPYPDELAVAAERGRIEQERQRRERAHGRQIIGIVSSRRETGPRGLNMQRTRSGALDVEAVFWPKSGLRRQRRCPAGAQAALLRDW